MIVHSSLKISSITFFDYYHDLIVNVLHHDDASLQCITRNSRLPQSEEVNNHWWQGLSQGSEFAVTTAVTEELYKPCHHPNAIHAFRQLSGHHDILY